MIWRDIQQIRKEKPLVHNITNYVVMNSSANALLSIGASPVMAHAIEEVVEMVGFAKALVINIGTLSAPWIEAMVAAGKKAHQQGIPIVLDPVGSGATAFRTNTAQRLIEEIRPSIIRGNASEIKSLARSGGPGAKGVDSQHTPQEALDDAHQLSQFAGCIVSVSGPTDLIVNGSAVVRVDNGHPMMTIVTGMGCSASAITGAFAAVNRELFQAAIHAMAVMGIAGEMAAERSIGPGSFQLNFLDALYNLKESDFAGRLKMDGPIL